MNFKILSINHVAVATKDINNLKFLFVNILGMNSSTEEYVENERVNVLKIFAEDNKTAIELLESEYENSTINKYINAKGQGIHHIALTVDKIQNAIDYLKNNGIKLVYEKPTLGADDKLITFIHPKSSPGMLIELCQEV